MNDMYLEVCCTSLKGCRIAYRNHADRIELCASMAAGGLTPSIGLFKAVKKECDIPICVMIRPRGSGYCYDESDFYIMQQDSEYFLKNGADAIVFGCLHTNQTIDEDKVKILCDLAHQYGKEAVFHRAIDQCDDIIQEVGKLINLGVDRVLTAGGKGNAFDQVDILCELYKKYQDKIQILVCGNIRSYNIKELNEKLPIKQVHSACRMMCQDAGVEKAEHLTYDNAYDSVDEVEVRNLRKQMHR